MSRTYVIAPKAVEDIENILEWSTQNFGATARERYLALLKAAIRDIADNPKRSGTRKRPEIREEVSTYHLRWSRDHVPPTTGTVKKPRHFLLFREKEDGTIEIGRVLHDSMDLERHLPPDYRY